MNRDRFKCRDSLEVVGNVHEDEREGGTIGGGE